jgi:formiminoglutamase
MIEHWVKPLNTEELFSSLKLEDFHFGNNIKIYEHKLPDLHAAQVVLLGLDETTSIAIRKHLYQCSFRFGDFKIVDLGNIRNKDNSFIIPVLSELVTLGITPIILGEQNYQFRAQLLAHRQMKREIGLTLVSKNLKILRTILSEFSDLSSDIFVKYFYALGIQAHYTNPALFEELDKNSYELLRLGDMQADIREVEPFIRNSDVFCFDISAIRSSEAPGQVQPTAGGLFMEQACQTCRYAGFNPGIGSFGIYGYNPNLDRDELTASTIAQMIWYFLDGHQHREKEDPQNKEGMLEFVVDYKIKDEPVRFYKSIGSGKWWVDISFMYPNRGENDILAPCSYEDYVKLCNDELSERLMKLIKRSIS